MAHIWARIKHLARFSRLVLSAKAASTMQKINLVACFNLCHLRFVIYIYFLLFEENHQNRISRAGEKISLTISLFFRECMIKIF